VQHIISKNIKQGTDPHKIVLGNIIISKEHIILIYVQYKNQTTQKIIYARKKKNNKQKQKRKQTKQWAKMISKEHQNKERKIL
jgi:hypothetical protein